jgi:hypothetical protein
MPQGYASATDTAVTTMISAKGPGTVLKVTMISFRNNSAAEVGAEIYSGSNKIWGPVTVPAGGGNDLVFSVQPLVCNDNEALGFKATGATTTLYGSAVAQS